MSSYLRCGDDGPLDGFVDFALQEPTVSDANSNDEIFEENIIDKSTNLTVSNTNLNDKIF